MSEGLILKRALRGGNWNNGANAGLFNLNLNNVATNANNNIGLRSAFGNSQKLHFQGNVISAISKGILVLADKMFIALCDRTTAKKIETSISGVVIPFNYGVNLPMEIAA